MTRTKRPRRVPAWLREVPTAVDGSMTQSPTGLLFAGQARTKPSDAGPFASQLIDAACALFQVAMTQAEEMRGPPGPLSMMLAVMRQSDRHPFARDEGPTAQQAAPGWAVDMAHLIDRTASHRDNRAEARRALITTLNPPRRNLTAMVLPASRMATALWFAVALVRRAIMDPVEASARFDVVAAHIHAIELHFWQGQGGWPWKPVDIPPDMLFDAQTRVARLYGQPATTGQA